MTEVLNFVGWAILVVMVFAAFAFAAIMVLYAWFTMKDTRPIFVGVTGLVGLMLLAAWMTKL